MANTLKIGDNTYDMELLRSLAERDGPGALVAQAALDVGDVDTTPPPSDTPTVEAAGD